MLYGRYSLRFIIAVLLLARALVVVSIFVVWNFIPLKSASIGKSVVRWVVFDVPPYGLSLQPS